MRQKILKEDNILYSCGLIQAVWRVTVLILLSFISTFMPPGNQNINNIY